MLATLLLALVAHASVERPAVPIRVVLVDPKGNDVTKEAAAPGSKLEVELLRWVGDGEATSAGKCELGAAIPVVPPSDVAWGVGLPIPLHDERPDAPGKTALAPGWAYVGDPCPEIEVAAKATGEQVLPILVARTRTVLLSLELPDGYTVDDNFRAFGMIFPEAGMQTGFEFLEYTLPPRVLTSIRLELPPGRHTAWGIARYRNRWAPATKLWAREEFVVTDADVQRVVIRYRTGVSITGRMTRPTGEPIASDSGVFLSVIDTRKRSAHALWYEMSSQWTADIGAAGRFELHGMPPGIEVTVPVRAGFEGKKRLRIPESGGDVGTIVVD